MYHQVVTKSVKVFLYNLPVGITSYAQQLIYFLVNENKLKYSLYIFFLRKKHTHKKPPGLQIKISNASETSYKWKQRRTKFMEERRTKLLIHEQMHKDAVAQFIFANVLQVPEISNKNFVEQKKNIGIMKKKNILYPMGQLFFSLFSH